MAEISHDPAALEDASLARLAASDPATARYFAQGADDDVTRDANRAALQRLAHPDGETATAAGAGARGTPMIVSMAATTAIESLAPLAPVWMQVYVLRDRGRTRAFCERAADAGARAIVVSAAVPFGIRNGRLSLPPERAGRLTARPTMRLSRQERRAQRARPESTVLNDLGADLRRALAAWGAPSIAAVDRDLLAAVPFEPGGDYGRRR